MIAGTLEIQLLANMARLQSDMDKAKRTVSGAVDTMNKVLGTIGVGVSLAGITSMIKSVTDTGDKLNDLRKISGLAVEELGGLGKVAAMSGSNLDTVAKAVGVMSKNMYAGAQAFDVLGIATKDADGNLRSANQVLLDVADRFSRMQDGAQKSAIANQLFGKSGRELIPLLNEGRAELEAATQAYAAHSGMTQKVAEDSDRFNDILAMLGGRVTAIKTSFVAELLPTLNAIGNAMLSTSQSTNQFSFAANVAVPVLKGLAIGAFTVVDTFQGMGREIGARAAQLVAFASGDFSGAKFIGNALAEDNEKSRAEYDKFVKTIMESDKAVAQLTETQKEYLKIEQQVPGVVEKTTKALKEKKVLTDAEQLAILRTNESTKATIALAQKVESITDSVATEQERYNQKLEELDRLKPYLSVETYNRALQKAQDELDKTAQKTVTTTDEVSQLWIQAGRNIQSALGNAVFDFFNGGLENMVSNVKNTVLRIAAEFAGLKIANMLGIAQMFGAAGTSSGGSSTAGLLASIASMFSGARTGNAGVFNANGGAGTAFIGGAGTAIGGSGTSKGSGISSVMSLASLAGPYGMAAAAAFAVLNALEKKVGDYELSGGAKFALGAYETFSPMSYVVKGLGLQTPEALIGKFLFGRGPYKFRQQSIQGDITSGGLDGTITDVYRSKGAVFTGNRHKSFEYQIPGEISRTIDKSIKSIYQSSHEFATNLGLDASLVDRFTKEIQVKSEKGKTLTGQAITDMLDGLGDDIAKAVLPAFDTFNEMGESAAQTLQRLSNEFTVLTSATQLLFGKTADQSKSFINQFGFGDRTAFLDKAGGIDAFSAMVDGFAQNFLTDDQRMRPVIESLVKQRDALGLSGINTRAQFTNAVQSGNLNQDQLLFLLKNQDAINQVFIYLDKFNSAVEETAAVTAKAARELNIRNADETEYGQRLNKGISETTQAIAELEGIASRLAGTVNSINPLSVTQARAIVSSGNPYDPNLQSALSTLSGMGTSGFSSRADFARSQGQNVTAVNSLQSSISAMTVSKEAQKAQYEYEKQLLQEGLNRAASMFSNIASFDTGGTVPKTGLAVIHKDEQIINPQQNNEIVSMLSEIAEQVKKTADTLVRVTRNGNSLVTTTTP